jgi:hypothetical protein
MRDYMQISARVLSWPHCCACCGGAADSHLRAVASKSKGKRKVVTTSSWWEIPYCHRCIEHVSRLRRARSIPLAGLVVAIIVALAAAAISESDAAAWIMGLLTAGLGLYLGWRETSRVTSSLSPTCAGPGVAVEHRGWYEQRTTSFLPANHT